jgi:nucleoside-diphosphate-sugar epimerase
MVQEAAGTALEPDVQGTARHEIDEQFLSSAKAAKLLGWHPSCTLAEALRVTVDWYREHLSSAAP